MRVAEAPVDLVGLFAAHRLGLVRLAYLLVDDLTLAADLVQDAFPVAALGYLRTSVVNGSAARSAAAAPFAPMPTGSDPSPRMPNRPIGS